MPTPAMSVSPRSGVRGAWLLLLAYPVLALAGAWLQRPALAVLGIALALTGPCLAAGRLVAWVPWLVAELALGWLAWHDLAVLVLGTIPVLVQWTLALVFGASLLPGRQPLVARAIEAIEGAERLAQPRVAGYARGVTWFWTALLALQGALVLAGTACSAPGAWHCTWMPPRRWVLGYLQFGGYAVLGLAFVGEYGWRRWYLRHLPHPSFRQFMQRLAAAWPGLVRGRHVR